MNIFDFITQDEIDDLPIDDPNQAFITFVRIVQRRLGERTAELSNDERENWTLIEEARHGSMNIIVAAAKRYEIEQFALLEVPTIRQFDNDTYRQFKADLDHYLTQIILDNSSRAKKDSVYVSPELKDTIRIHLHLLRKTIKSATDISDDRKNALLAKLVEFEAELDKKRLSLLAVTLLTITLLAALVHQQN